MPRTINKIFNLQLPSVQEKRTSLMQHPMYKMINTPDRLHIFMEHHVFAVWDFMSLLKRLQRDLTCVSVPWIPVENPRFSRIINEIVIGEETDENGEGGYTSHFQLYCEAMKDCGADTTNIQQVITLIRNGMHPLEVLKNLNISQAISSFVHNSLQIAMYGKIHEVAAAFFFSRGDIIPDMFKQLVPVLEEQGYAVDRLIYYLNRHIELDGDEHGPLADELLQYLCGDDSKRWEEAEQVAIRCIDMRIKLWDSVISEIKGH